ncbi:UNVERIFIED_CONTAM: hypothetical protein PYX00_008161 [Menopon gallinae]|uniref:Ribosomal RNA-processing protein 7 C-terminal domain-containing protein n=1 Tax=Menopon gallinae TaxID=328185 RepID=A0AAW2HLS6_9NEOP
MQGFKALRVKYNERSKVPRMLYMKAHSVREKVPEKPKDRTLFVVGVPPYYTKETFKALFEPFGTVTAVYFHKTPTVQAPPVDKSKFFRSEAPVLGYKVAYVVFKKSKELEELLEFDDVLVLPNDSTKTGFKKWASDYNNELPDSVELEKEIKEFMEKFDEEVAKEIERDKQLREGDEDGWITVTKRGKRPGLALKESVQTHLKKKYEMQKKKRELTDFYTFQIKESKMKNLIALRKKFEDDKKKITALKQTRKFKPF